MLYNLYDVECKAPWGTHLLARIFAISYEAAKSRLRVDDNAWYHITRYALLEVNIPESEVSRVVVVEVLHE